MKDKIYQLCNGSNVIAEATSISGLEMPALKWFETGQVEQLQIKIRDDNAHWTVPDAKSLSWKENTIVSFDDALTVSEANSLIDIFNRRGGRACGDEFS
jgi:hypothetical protein